MKFKLFLMGVMAGVFLSSGVNAALIPECSNILVPPGYNECMLKTKNDCLKCAEKAPRQVQACLCFGQQPASYQCFMDGHMPITVYFDHISLGKHKHGYSGVCMKSDDTGCDVWQYYYGRCHKWVDMKLLTAESDTKISSVMYCNLLQGRVEGTNCVNIPRYNGPVSCSLSDLVAGKCKP